jgi:hypothetical protein
MRFWLLAPFMQRVQMGGFAEVGSLCLHHTIKDVIQTNVGQMDGAEHHAIFGQRREPKSMWEFGEVPS